MSLFRVLLFAIVGVLIVMGVYITRRSARLLSLERPAKLALALVLLAGPVLLLVGRGQQYGLEGGDARNVAIVGTAITLGMIFSAVLLALYDVPAWLSLRWKRWRARRERNEEPSAEAPVLTRRQALVSGGALIAGPSLSTYASTFGRHDYETVDVPVRLDGLPRQLDGFTIVQLSDIHIGSFVDESQLAAAVDRARAARGDLIVLTGDLLDHEARYAPRLGRLVRDLAPHARHGVAAILGNHDHYAGADAVADAVRRGGGRMLINDGFMPEPGLALLGVDDLWARGTRGPDLDAALAQVRPDAARVLLCHQPEFFHDHAGTVQLQLSGHTHGGQISLGVNPASIVLPHGYVRGRYEKDGGQLYVNRGFGTAGPPARLGSAPEITRVVLTV